MPRRAAAYLADIIAGEAMAVLALASLLAVLAAAGHAGARPAGISGAGACVLDAVNRDATAEVAAVFQFFRHGSAGNPEVRSLMPSAPRRHVTFDPAAAGLMPGAWAAIAVGTGPLGVVRRCGWPTSGGAIAGGAAQDGTVLVAPFVRQAGRDEVAVLSIQNADAAAAATVELGVHVGGPSPALTVTYTINPGTAVTIDTARDPNFVGLPDIGVGAIVVRAPSAIAGDLLVDLTASARGVADAAFQRAEDAATALVLPRLRRGADGDGTRVQLVNPGEGAGQASLRVVGTAGACAGADYDVGPVDVPAAGAVEIDLTGAAAGLPEGCTAAGVLTSTIAVLGVALETAGAARDAGAYEAVSVASAQRALYAPRWTAGTGGSTLDLFNPGPEAADVTLTPLGPDGAEVACRAGCALTLAPGAGARVAAADLDDDLPDGAVGALIVEGSAPLAAVLGEGGPGSASDLTLMGLVGLDPPAGGPFAPERWHVPLVLVPRLPPTATPPSSATPTPGGSATIVRPNQTPTPDGTQPTATSTATPTPSPTPGEPEPTGVATDVATPGEPAPTSATTLTPGEPEPTVEGTQTATPNGPVPTAPPPTEPLPTPRTPSPDPGAVARVFLPWGER